MKLVTYNIQYSRGRDNVYDIARVAETVKDADIIALQEVERHFDRSGDIDQPAALADALPNHYWMYGPTVDIFKGGPDEGARINNRRRQFGNMILSRYPIMSSRNHLFANYTHPDAMTIQRGVIEATVDTPVGPIRIYSTHLCHLSARQRAIQLQTILDIHARAFADGETMSGHAPDGGWNEAIQPLPVPANAVLMGDMNFTPASDEYTLICGPWNDWRAMRTTSVDGFADAWTSAGHAEDEGDTIYRDWDTRSGKRIDFCFLSPPLAQRVSSCRVDTDAIASDHQPVWTELADG